MSDAKEIYEITEKFNIEDWKQFARTKLEVANTTIEEIESKYKNQLKEIKYQTVCHWQGNLKGFELCDELKRHKHEYFCGSYSEQVVSSVPSYVVEEASGDKAGAAAALPSEGEPTRETYEPDVYSLYNKKGRVLIISNSFHDQNKNFKSRKPGCDKDVEKMVKLWKHLGCELYLRKPHVDKSASEMCGLLRGVTQLPKSECAFVVVIIMTHGDLDKDGNEVVCGNDGIGIPKTVIDSMFRNDNAIDLHNIPKFFINQWCRGRRDMIPIPCEENGLKVEACASETIPVICDTVTIHSAPADHAAYISKNGSFLIKAIYNIFWKYGKPDVKNAIARKNVVDMLSLVNAEMWKEFGISEGVPIRPMSVFESSLVKTFYLTN
uniref:uncharacterized protein LOC120332231 n=1 Tax=Styela clava TaxID=7725 RepID=UPI0019392C45|nr:uncharacterized protein LOC120332231 [Styela clava]